jgi:hypothetical protein
MSDVYLEKSGDFQRTTTTVGVYKDGVPCPVLDVVSEFNSPSNYANYVAAIPTGTKITPITNVGVVPAEIDYSNIKKVRAVTKFLNNLRDVEHTRLVKHAQEVVTNYI